MLRLIDRALSYVSAVLRLVDKKYPEALKAHDENENISLDYIMQFSSVDDLIADRIERRVYSLSFRGLLELGKYLKRHHNISLFANDTEREQIVLLGDIRNLIVHARGIVNQVFKDRHPNSSEDIGNRIMFVAYGRQDPFRSIVDWIMGLDTRFIDEFKLPTQPRVPRPDPGKSAEVTA